MMTVSSLNASTTPLVTATAALRAAVVAAAAPATPRVNTALAVQAEATRGDAHTTFERHMKSNATDNHEKNKKITIFTMDALPFGDEAGARQIGHDARLCISHLEFLTHDRTTFMYLSPLGRGHHQGPWMTIRDELYLELLYPLMKILSTELFFS